MRNAPLRLLGFCTGCDNPCDSFVLLNGISMIGRASPAILLLLLLSHGCSGPSQPIQLRYKAVGPTPELLAVYEAWFGEPGHISVGYSSHDADQIGKQIDAVKQVGISAFVVDWYGDRDIWIDQSYAQVQKQAAKHDFHVAMMYDEANNEDGATDETIADFNVFHDTYLTDKAHGHEAYLTYQGRPVIFIFPKGGHTDWDKVRSAVNKWNPAPLLIEENLPGRYAADFDGFYPWINPGPQGWSPDGSQWGEQYLGSFYQTMGTKSPDKMVVGGAWAQFDDSKASWGLNRHIAPRCGQTLKDTLNLWRRIYPADQIIPFVLIETWNDYDEGSAIEPGIPACGQPVPTQGQQTDSQGPTSLTGKP
jgi:hypothetical protein